MFDRVLIMHLLFFVFFEQLMISKFASNISPICWLKPDFWNYHGFGGVCETASLVIPKAIS